MKPCRTETHLNFGKKSLNNQNKQQEDMNGKQGQFRIQFGIVDGFSLMIIIIGIYLILTGELILGWIFVVGGFVKQFVWL